MKIKFMILLLVVAFYSNIKPQGEAALPFLTLNPDPQSLAMGMGGAANVSSDPMGYYYNPALLGYFSQKTNFSYQTYAETPHWFIPELKMFTNAFTLGYKYENLLNDLNISAGFGYMRYKFSYGLFTRLNEQGQIIEEGRESFDKYDAYTFGFSVDYLVNLSFGMSFKNINSVLGDLRTKEVKTKATDWGLLLNVPVLKLINDDIVYNAGSTELKPFLNFALGYSRLNEGDEIFYIDPFQSDPIPLTSHLGYNLSIGTDIELFDNTFRLIDINFIIDASDILIKYDSISGKSYQSGIGDIDIIENLVKWSATDKTIIRKGKSLTLLETVSLLGGSIYGSGIEGIYSSGVVVSSGGLFKLLSSVVFNNDPYTKYILNHLELKYVNATTFEDHPFTSKSSSFTVAVKNLSLW